MTKPPPVEHSGVLITGALGSGKTSAAVELGHVLAEAEEPVAVVDLDWLGWIYVPEDNPAITELIASNLGAVWANYERAGIRHLVMARTLLAEDEVEMIRRAVPGVTFKVVHLTASPDLVFERLRSRDVGAEMEENLRESATLSGGTGTEDFTIANEDRPIREVALEILAFLDWPTASS